ncbi:MAG: hypothetical protein K0S32_3247 [Bacteroidetes bacterium]|jgi:hypothetical protein|nr:hypothetical protein [Bacteroidota bacterium]
MSSITIIRSKEFKSSIRSIVIEVNGREIGAIKNGETRKYDLEPGNNYIKATLDRICTSNPIELELQQGQNEVLKLSHKKGIAILNMIFDAKNYLVLEKLH